MRKGKKFNSYTFYAFPIPLIVAAAALIIGAAAVGGRALLDAITQPGVNAPAAPQAAAINGTVSEYLDWVRNGGRFTVDDDDLQVSPIVNDAYIWLASGRTDSGARQRYRDALIGPVGLMARNYAFPDNGCRSLADLLETYIEMRSEFTTGERDTLETWFRERVNFKIWNPDGTIKADAGYQAVGAGLAAVASYVFNDAGLRDFANTAMSFCQGWSPSENSSSYVSYLMMTAFRVTKYANGGLDNDAGCVQGNQSKRANLANLITWILQTYPHNGDTLSYGRTWYRNHLNPMFNILYAGAYYLRSSNPTLAAQSKWMADQMFSYYLTHNQEFFRPGPGLTTAGRFEANPIYLYWYLRDDQISVIPNMGSMPIRSRNLVWEDGGGWDNSPLRSGWLDKVVLRDGWGPDALYVQLEAAPWANKYLPYGNSIEQIVFGTESFSTGHTAEGNENRDKVWWPERNTAYAELGGNIHSQWDLGVARNAYLCRDRCYYPDVTWGTSQYPTGNDWQNGFTETNDVVTSTTYMVPRNVDNAYGNNDGPSDRGWKRTIRLYKTGERRIEVVDELPTSVAYTPPPDVQPPPAPGVYWNFQADQLTWRDDGTGVRLEKNGYCMDVNWGNSVVHEYTQVDTVGAVEGCRAYYPIIQRMHCFWATPAEVNWGWGYVGQTDHKIRLSGVRTYTTTFTPCGAPTPTPTPTPGGPTPTPGGPTPTPGGPTPTPGGPTPTPGGPTPTPGGPTPTPTSTPTPTPGGPTPTPIPPECDVL